MLPQRQTAFHLFGDSVHRQAAVSGSSNTQQPAWSNVMHDGKELRETATLCSCCKGLREIATECLDVEKILVEWKERS